MHVRWVVISAVLVVLVGTLGFAQARGGGSWMPPRMGMGADRVSTMARHDMMPACQTHCQATATNLKRLV
jgi:hypothetical protein